MFDLQCPCAVDVERTFCGQREAERLLELGVLVGTAELKQLRMVDSVVEATQELLPAAIEEAGRWLAFPDLGRSEMKVLPPRIFQAYCKLVFPFVTLRPIPLSLKCIFIISR